MRKDRNYNFFAFCYRSRYMIRSDIEVFVFNSSVYKLHRVYFLIKRNHLRRNVTVLWDARQFYVSLVQFILCLPLDTNTYVKWRIYIYVVRVFSVKNSNVERRDSYVCVCIFIRGPIISRSHFDAKISLDVPI